MTEGTVTDSDCKPPGYGCPVAEVYYTYAVGNETHTGVHQKGFIFVSSGEYYARLLPSGKRIVVRFNPENPDISFVLDDDQVGLRAAIIHTPHPESFAVDNK